MNFFLSGGIILGLSAGFSPGPLTTLVITQSLQHGMKEGVKTALAPFITDLPIILVSLLALSQFQQSQGILGLISLAGGLFLVYLAYMSFKTKAVDVDAGPSKPRSLTKGTLVNFLSPAPYVFWLTVGAPYAVQAWGESGLTAAAFFIGFYACLIGGKISMAVFASKSRQLMNGPVYSYVMRILGVLLLVFAYSYFRDAAVMIAAF
jgi:threonine/homoserine/homoserine lactone efflux protein